MSDIMPAIPATAFNNILNLSRFAFESLGIENPHLATRLAETVNDVITKHKALHQPPVYPLETQEFPMPVQRTSDIFAFVRSFLNSLGAQNQDLTAAIANAVGLVKEYYNGFHRQLNPGLVAAKRADFLLSVDLRKAIDESDTMETCISDRNGKDPIFNIKNIRLPDNQLHDIKIRPYQSIARGSDIERQWQGQGAGSLVIDYEQFAHFTMLRNLYPHKDLIVGLIDKALSDNNLLDGWGNPVPKS